MIPAIVLRELGADKLRFTSVKRAVLWYRDQIARRLRRCVILELGSAPCSADEKDRTNATFAAMACVMRDVSEPHWLVAWYETTDGDGGWLAGLAGMTRERFTARCYRTERAIRNRMEDAGLLREEEYANP